MNERSIYSNDLSLINVTKIRSEVKLCNENAQANITLHAKCNMLLVIIGM